MSYSPDFRALVIKKINSGMSLSEASRLFEVSRDSIYNWLKLYSTTDSFNDRVRKEYSPKKIDKKGIIKETWC